MTKIRQLRGRSLTGALASRRALSSRGFDIHAGVSVSAHDREGRERLLRYCARPPLSLERLRVLADGRVAYRIKNPRGHQTQRVMSPVPSRTGTRLPARRPRPELAAKGRQATPTRTATYPWRRSGRSKVVDLLRAAHEARPQSPWLPRSPSRAIRASIGPPLLKRVHDVDALACPCGGRLRVIALITEPEVVVAILTSLHLPASAAPIARARSPDYDPAPD
jgi:Putative transposase